MDILYTLGMVSGLALVTSINAYFPLLVVAIVARFHFYPIQINPMFTFMTSDWFIALCVILVLLNFVADKIPGVSGVWNSVHIVLHLLAGALVAGALGPSHTVFLLLRVILGVGLSAIGTITKLAVRTAASLATGGCASPFLSLAEDGLVVFMSAVAIIIPVVMLVITPVGIVLFILFAPRLWKAHRSQWRILSSFIAWGAGKRPTRRMPETPVRQKTKSS